MPAQLELDLFDPPPPLTIYVVRNCWGPEFHLQDEHKMSFCHSEQPRFFETVGEAVEFAVVRGVRPVVRPECLRVPCRGLLQ